MRLSFPLAVFCLALTSFLTGVSRADPGTAREFLHQHSLVESLPEKPANFSSLRAEIARTPDPASQFGYIVFSLGRHKDKLLDPEQGEKLTSLIEERKRAAINWHDVRNVVRVRAQIALWEYAEADEKAAALKKERWNTWTDLRLEFMFQEFVDKERFQRDAWNILTEVQKQSLLSGKWDEYLKKSTGHRRLFSADKQITRILGRPDHPDKFETLEATWRSRWEKMWNTYQEAAAFERKREFAMDLASGEFSLHAWKDFYEPAFRDFATHECEAIRELLQTGYQRDSKTLQSLEDHRTGLRSDALEKYSHCPDELLAVLKTREPNQINQ